MRKWFDFSNQSYNEQVNMKDYTQKVNSWAIKLYYKNGYP